MRIWPDSSNTLRQALAAFDSDQSGREYIFVTTYEHVQRLANDVDCAFWPRCVSSLVEWDFGRMEPEAVLRCESVFRHTASRTNLQVFRPFFDRELAERHFFHLDRPIARRSQQYADWLYDQQDDDDNEEEQDDHDADRDDRKSRNKRSDSSKRVQTFLTSFLKRKKRTFVVATAELIDEEARKQAEALSLSIDKCLRPKRSKPNFMGAAPPFPPH